MCSLRSGWLRNRTAVKVRCYLQTLALNRVVVYKLSQLALNRCRKFDRWQTDFLNSLTLLPLHTPCFLFTCTAKETKWEGRLKKEMTRAVNMGSCSSHENICHRWPKAWTNSSRSGVMVAVLYSCLCFFSFCSRKLMK